VKYEKMSATKPIAKTPMTIQTPPDKVYANGTVEEKLIIAGGSQIS
jgi:hypothetical protein